MLIRIYHKDLDLCFSYRSRVLHILLMDSLLDIQRDARGRSTRTSTPSLPPPEGITTIKTGYQKKKG